MYIDPTAPDLFGPDDSVTGTGNPPRLPLAFALRKRRGGFGFEAGDQSVLPQATAAAASVPADPVQQQRVLPNAARASNLGGLAAGYDTQISNYQQQLAELNKDPDYTDMSAAARTRGGQGVQVLGAALAAGMGPKDMQGLQSQFAQQSTHLMQPQKIEGGEIDVSGQVHLDPGYKRQKQITDLRASIETLERQKLTAVTAEERLRTEQMQREQMMELRRLQMQQSAEAAADRRAIAQQSLDLRREIAEGKREGGQLSKKDQYQVADRMGDDFRSQTKNYVTELDAARKILTLPTDRKWSPIEQQSAIVMLNKILDPGSVVREGEFDRVAQAQGVFQRAQLALDRLKSGATLSPALANDIREVADFYNKASSQRMDKIARDYTERAQRRGLDARDVVGIYAQPEPGAPQGDAAARASTYYQKGP